MSLMSYNPKISICITTYNLEKYISKCIDSVLNQNIDFPIEIVIIDDASTDTTPEILKNYQEKNPDLFQIYFNKKNLKYCRNYLKALSLCKGEFIAVLDGDDYWTDNDKLQRQLNIFEENPKATICYTDGIISDSIYQEKRFVKKEIEPVSSLEILLQNANIWNSSVMYRNIIDFDNLPNWIFQAIHPDYPLHVLYATKGKVKYIDEVMGVYRIHQNNISKVSSEEKRIKFMYNWVFIAEKLKKEVPNKFHYLLNLQKARQLDIIASYYRKQKNYPSFLKYFVKSYLTCPIRSIKEYKDSYYHLFKN